MNQDNNELFEKYYFERMNAAEIKAFRQRLEREPELKKQFRHFQLNAKLYHIDNTQANIKKVEKELEKSGFFEEQLIEAELPVSTTENIKETDSIPTNNKTTKIIPLYKKPVFKWAMAAAIILLPAIFFFSQNTKSNVDLSKIASQQNTINENLAFAKKISRKGFSPSNNDNPIDPDGFLYKSINQFTADLKAYKNQLNANNNQTLKFSSSSMTDGLKTFLTSSENTSNEKGTKKDIAYYLLGEYERLNHNGEKAKSYFNKSSDEPSVALTLMMLEGDPDSIKYHLNNIVANRSVDSTYFTRANKLLKVVSGI